MAAPDDNGLDCANLNATECILRAASEILAEVKKSGEEFNWDPASFAVTLIIGLIALFFAALTIGQALIAATPSKICSRYALGPWAHFSTKSMDWSEMKPQATAQTPIIRIKLVLMHLFQFESAGPQPERSDNMKADVALAKPSTTEKEKLELNPRSTYPPSKDRDEYFPATWLALLTSISLDHPGIWPTKPTRTDYIPSDLVAAPAYASIRDMVTLAALAAFPTKSRLQFAYQSDSTLAGVQHEEFDLDFRQHPSIGLHGVFQTFNTISSQWRVNDPTRREAQMPSRDMLTVILHANGLIPQKQGFDYDRQAILRLFDGSRIKDDWIDQEWIYERERLYRLGASSACIRPNQGSTGRCAEASTLFYCWCRHGHSGFALTRFAAIITASTDVLEGYQQGGSWVLLMAEIPQNLPSLFPKRAKNLAGRVQRLLPLSRFWSLQSDQSTTDGSDVAFGSFVPGNEPLKACRQYLRDIDEERVFELQSNDGLGSELGRELVRLDAFLGTISPGMLSCRMLCLGCAAIICDCLVRMKWTLVSEDRELYPWSRAHAEGDPAGERRIPLNFSSQASRRRVTDQWTTLEAFLSWYRGDPHRVDDDGTQRGRHVPGFSTNYKLGGDTQGSVAEELGKVLKIWEVDGNGEFAYKSVEVQHPVDDLLIYRAIMVAMLYTWAADNSDVLEGGIYNKTVPFL